MKAMRYSLVIVAMAIGIAGSSCGGDACPRAVVIEFSYTGTKSGELYWRDIFLPTGSVSGGATSSEKTQGPSAPVVISQSCYEHVAPQDETGFAIEAWMDTDGDDMATCPIQSIGDRGRCKPDPGEPQVLQEYTIARAGVTRVSIAMHD
jgi:hypothetical protein